MDAEKNKQTSHFHFEYMELKGKTTMVRCWCFKGLQKQWNMLEGDPMLRL